MKKIIWLLCILAIVIGWSVAQAKISRIRPVKISTGTNTAQIKSLLPKICNASGCYTFPEQSIGALRKQIRIGTGTSGLAMPTFDSIVFENKDCKKEKDKLDEQLANQYKLYQTKLDRLIAQGNTKKVAEWLAKPEYETYLQWKKANYTPSKLCYSHRTKNKRSIENTLTKRIQEYKSKLEKHNSSMGVYSGLQTFWKVCDPQGLSGTETNLNQLLTKGDWLKAREQVIKLDKIITDCLNKNRDNRSLQDQRFLKVIRFMRARLMFLKGYIAIAKWLIPGQLNPDIDDTRFALDLLLRDNDPLIIQEVKKLSNLLRAIPK